MTKNEMKNLKNRLNLKMGEIKTEIKALQRAIDIGKGDTGRLQEKFKDLKKLLSEL